MSESIKKFCEICQIKVEENGIFHLLDNNCKLKLLELLPEKIDLHLTQNSVICDQCFTQITDTQQEFKQLQIKDEDCRPSNNNLKELDTNFKEVVVNNSTICVKEEPGIENNFTQITDTQEFKQLQVKDEDKVLQQDVSSNNNFKEPDADFDDNTICVKEEPGVEKIKEEFNVGLIQDKVCRLQVMKVDFLVYIDKKNSTEMYYCCACGCCTDTKQKLTQHIYKQHRKKDSTTKKMYQRRSTHIVSQHTGKKPFWCDKCDFKSPRKDGLIKHKLTHANEKPYKCTQCKYSCNGIPSLKRHMIKHTGEYPFQCNECNYKSVIKTHLKRHILSQHTDGKPYRCDKCDYKTAARENLKVHEFSHTGEYPFQCDECDYKCAYKVNLKAHKFYHTNEKPYRCTQCKYSCSDVTDLNNHMGKHTGEYSFQCDKCDYKCVYKSFLNRHKLSYHPGEKKYHCDKCDYKCLRKSYLKVHESVHTNEYPLHCDKCDYKCVRKSSLKSHMSIHINEKPFKCTYCKYVSKQLKRFKLHMCQHTGESTHSNEKPAT